MGSLEVMSGNKLVVQNDGSNVDVLSESVGISSLTFTGEFLKRIIGIKWTYIGTG